MEINNSLKKIDESLKNIQEKKVIENFPFLEEIDLSFNLIKILEIKNCPKLNKINISNNMIYDIIFCFNEEKISFLELSSKNENDDDYSIFMEKVKRIFSEFPFLWNLNLSNNVGFSFSLKIVKFLKNLRILNITKVNILKDLNDFDLPKTLETLVCLKDDFPLKGYEKCIYYSEGENFAHYYNLTKIINEEKNKENELITI